MTLNVIHGCHAGAQFFFGFAISRFELNKIENEKKRWKNMCIKYAYVVYVYTNITHFIRFKYRFTSNSLHFWWTSYECMWKISLRLFCASCKLQQLHHAKAFKNVYDFFFCWYSLFFEPSILPHVIFVLFTLSPFSMLNQYTERIDSIHFYFICTSNRL